MQPSKGLHNQVVKIVVPYCTYAHYFKGLAAPWHSLIYFFFHSYIYSIAHSYSFSRSRNLERTISLRFLGIILRVLRLKVFVYNVDITNQFQTTFAQRGGGGVKSVSRGNCEEQGEKLSRFLSQILPRPPDCTVAACMR